MTLQELESLKQDRLTNQQARLQAARANAERAKICVELFCTAGFLATRRTFWEHVSHLEASDVEEAGEVFVEHHKIPLAEAEQLVAELTARP